MIIQCSTRMLTSTMMSDPHTTCRRVTNADVGGVADHGVCDAKRCATSTFSELASLLHSLCTSTVLLNDVEGSTLINLCFKAKSSLAGTTTSRTCIHGSQGDEDQRQKHLRGDHGTTSVDPSEKFKAFMFGF